MKQRTFLVSGFYFLSSVFGLASLAVTSVEILGKGPIEISFANPIMWLIIIAIQLKLEVIHGVQSLAIQLKLDEIHGAQSLPY